MEDIFASLNDVVVDADCWEKLPSNYTFNSEYQRQTARENALKRNINQKGANNRNAKTWHIVYADGREITIGGLQRWAVDNGYSASGIKNIAYGKWKKYRDLVSVTEVAQEAPTAP